MLSRVRNRRSMLGAAVFFIIIGIVITFTYNIGNAIEVNNVVLSEVTKVIIDPGHGGVDPGAIGVSGIKEKDINLAIGLYLRDILIANGYEVIMTRDTDISINDEQYKSIGKIKTSDLKNRRRIMDNNPDAIAISIHQNKFPQESSSGSQMFYGRKNERSEILAKSLKQAFNDNLQPDNKREIKRSTSSIYVIHNTEIPITLVECGFISNYKDAKKLTDIEYQQKVAFTIFCGIVKAKTLQTTNETEN